MAAEWLNLQGKTCVVTGASGGIGQAIMQAFSEAGANVVGLDINAKTCTEAVAQLPGNNLALRCDISQEREVAAAVEAVLSAYGRCDVLVNNAAVLKPSPLAEISLDDWQKSLSVNLNGYVVCAVLFGRAMLKQGAGSIIHVGSVAAHFPQPNGVDYSTSKSGILAFSKQIAVEWGPNGIRSNVVSPGMIQTPLTAKLNADPEVVAKRQRMTASRRLGVPSDIANVVAFMASDRSAYVNGAELLVTGGLHAMLMDLIPQPGWKKK